MATSILERPATTNPYLVQLAEVPDSVRNNCSWLVITHDDPLLLMKIRDAMGKQPCIVLQMPQSTWARDRDLWVQALSEFLPQSAITDIAVVGHSQANTAASQPALGTNLAAGGDDSDSGDLYRTLLQRVKTAQVHRDLAKQEVVNQFHFLASHECLAEVAPRPFDVHAFFYMAENGLFQRYDAKQQAFIGNG